MWTDNAADVTTLLAVIGRRVRLGLGDFADIGRQCDADPLEDLADIVASSAARSETSTYLSSSKAFGPRAKTVSWDVQCVPALCSAPKGLINFRCVRQVQGCTLVLPFDEGSAIDKPPEPFDFEYEIV
jgi:hypothetical protein